MSDEFKDFVVEGEKYDLEWSHQGEGHNGDYDYEDYEDAPLVRLTLFNKDGSQVDRGSCCTNIETDVTPSESKIISKKVFDLLESQISVKRAMELVSYFDRGVAYK